MGDKIVTAIIAAVHVSQHLEGHFWKRPLANTRHPSVAWLDVTDMANNLGASILVRLVFWLVAVVDRFAACL